MTDVYASASFASLLLLDLQRMHEKAIAVMRATNRTATVTMRMIFVVERDEEEEEEGSP